MQLVFPGMTVNKCRQLLESRCSALPKYEKNRKCTVKRNIKITKTFHKIFPHSTNNSNFMLVYHIQTYMFVDVCGWALTQWPKILFYGMVSLFRHMPYSHFYLNKHTLAISSYITHLPFFIHLSATHAPASNCTPQI